LKICISLLFEVDALKTKEKSLFYLSSSFSTMFIRILSFKISGTSMNFSPLSAILSCFNVKLDLELYRSESSRYGFMFY
jgi:hypothetical protein